ncbi:MAG: MerR family transcriptional regulator [Lachnospiraceae bacterium]|nr:MerR family transcriptional regulator [Lachnospiraceae bacterium]
MKLRDICEKTAVSKRNIHFYIKEGLLVPKQDPENGYYDFSENDCLRLTLIRNLRSAGFSLAQIRALLTNPSTSVYYMNLRLRELKAEHSRIEQLEEAISYIQQNLPLHPGLPSLIRLLENAGLPEVSAESAQNTLDFEESDSDLVNRYLWEVFMPEGPLSDYQEFLWSKVNHFSSGSCAEDYRLLSRTLHGFTDDQITAYFSGNRKLHEEVIFLEPSEYVSYAEKMKTSIRHFLVHPQSVRRWRMQYTSLTAPSARLYDSEIARTMDELSPTFAAYRVHVHAVCDLVYDWLHSAEGQDTLSLMKKTLEGCFDIDHCSHGELQAMISF